MFCYCQNVRMAVRRYHAEDTIYLTEEERRALAVIAGRAQSELIREAVDGFLDR